jgi:ketosteroid isomerase-like protein
MGKMVAQFRPRGNAGRVGIVFHTGTGADHFKGPARKADEMDTHLMTPTPSPIAPSTPRLSPQEEVLRWLEDFAGCVRAVDYDRAREMFDVDVVGFGTFARMLIGRENLANGQWRNIWGCTRGFRFKLDEARVETIGEMAWIASPWHSEGRDEEGNWFDRHGRCTLILRRRGGRWLCVHSHHSRRPEPSSAAGGATPA